LAREAYGRSSTTLDIFSLEGKVPDTIVKGQNSDISPLVEYAWYEWVKFWDTGQSFPDSKEWLGRDLGPEIDIGPAISRKFLKINGEVMFRVSVRDWFWMKCRAQMSRSGVKNTAKRSR
jgi:hypothetical protein